MATMKLFYSNISHLKNPAPITMCESNWIESANYGGLTFAEKTDWFDGYNYDGNSFYSSNLLKFGIPMESGEFKTLNEFENFFRYGIYRCKVYHSGDNKIDRLFKLNKSFYTHFDLEGAKLLGLKIELINDENPNHLCYTGKHIRGDIVFKTTIEYLYKLKQDGVPRAKELLSKLWGSLGRKNKHYLNSKYKTDIPEEADILSITENKNGNYHVEYTLPEAENLYCHSFGRISPFIQAYGRYQMARIILPNNEYIVRGHTDSFLANKKLELGTFWGLN